MQKEMVIPEIKMTLSFDKKIKKSDLFEIKCAFDMYEAFRQVFNKDTFDWVEEFILLCLNKRNAVVGFYKVSSGGLTGTVADPRVILTIALNCMATSIIIAHNHPSGNLKPSGDDIAITNKIKMAASFLDIKLLDHLIMTDESYYSFYNNGLL